MLVFTENADNKLCGDVDFDDVAPVASKITPVPGRRPDDHRDAYEKLCGIRPA